MTEPTNGAAETETTDATSGSDNGTREADAPPKWFQDFASKIEGRIGDLGRDLGRVREKVKKGKEPEAVESTKQKSPTGVTREEVGAALRLGEVRANLSKDAREYLDQRLADGDSYASVTELAEAIVKFGAPANGAGKADAKSAPRGHGANPAHSSAGEPQTLAELLQLKETNPKRYAELMDPNHPFDLNRVMQRRK